MISYQDVFVSTACLASTQDLVSRILLYQSQGLNAIELGAGVYAQPDVLHCLNQLGGRYLVHNYFPPPPMPFVLNLASADDDVRQLSLDLVLDAIDLCAMLGAPFYSVHAGFITDPTGFANGSFVFPMPESPRDAFVARDRFAATLKIALRKAERLGLQVLVENNVCSRGLLGRLLLQTADEFLDLIGSVAAPNFGILLDTGHLNVTAHTLGLSRMEMIEKMAPYVRALHVHDNDGQIDQHRPVQTNSWVMDVLHYAEFIHLPVVIEARFGNVAEVRLHVDWLTERICRNRLQNLSR